MAENLEMLVGDCRAVLPTLEAGSVQTCITSPPYWGLRDSVGKIALELGRKAILIELNPDYVEMARDRTSVTPGFF